MARKNRSLKLLRLARNKKSLIWQKRYLTKLLEQQYHRQNVSVSNPISTPQASMLFDLKVNLILREDIYIYILQTLYMFQKQYIHPNLQSNIGSGQSSNQNESAIGIQDINTDTANFPVPIGNRFR